MNAARDLPNPGRMSDADIAAFALKTGGKYFDYLLHKGLLKDDSLFIRVGTIDGDGQYVELGTMSYGDKEKAGQFAANTDPSDGKLYTVVFYRKDSSWVSQTFGRSLAPDDDPRTWIGGVFHEARVKLPDENWDDHVFVGAASGVQGWFDEAVTRQVLSLMGALWAQRAVDTTLAGAQSVDA